MNSNLKKQLLFQTIGYAIMVIPVAIYNIANFDMFTKVSQLKLSFSFVIALSMISMAFLTKVKQKAGIYTIIAGVFLALLGEISTQIGWNILIIGIANTIDTLIFNKLANHYKEGYYADTGRQVIYSREFDS